MRTCGEIRAGLRLGQAHRAGPLAGDEVGDVALLLLVRTDQLDRFDRALIEQRTVGEADVRGVPHLQRRAEQHLRQTLAAVFRGNRQADPSGIGELLVGLFETRRRRDLTVLPGAAVAIADSVERIEHAGCKGRRLFEHGVQHVERLFTAGKGGNVVDSGELSKGELHVPKGGSIGAHGAIVRDRPWRTHRALRLKLGTLGH